MTPDYWQRLADALAEDAGENHFPSRRGFWGIEDSDILCVYNNNPYADDPHRRDRELVKFREVLAQKGVKELAFGIYPKTGESAGYTYAMLIDAPVALQQHYVNIFTEIVRAELYKACEQLAP